MIHTISTDTPQIAYAFGDTGDGFPVLLLHGRPDDASGWTEVAPALEAAGYRWVVPWLRGFGATRFRTSQTVRDGTVALTYDAIDLADALDACRGKRAVDAGAQVPGHHRGIVPITASDRGPVTTVALEKFSANSNSVHTLR